MTAAAMLADEDYVLPEALRAKVLRRRGDGGAPTSIDESPDRLLPWIDKVCAMADSSFEKALADPASEPDLIAAATAPEFASLPEASPLQAGLRAALVYGALVYGALRLDTAPQRFVDTRVLARGLTFAVRAMAESCDACVMSPNGYYGSLGNPRFVRGSDGYRHVKLRWTAAARLLALLADATDAEYSEAMSAASEYRDGSRDQRALTSFLFRERSEWVDADVRDAELKASVHDVSGRRLKNLPKPAAGDDPELAKTAARAFAELKKQARTVVADQVARLERAMVLRRRWDAVEFSAFFVHHPLVRHILLVATLDPGITVGDVAESADQVFEGVWISRDGRAGHRPVPEWSDPFGTLDPVTASEILRDLTEVTAQ